jgi:hypothetical protein
MKSKLSDVKVKPDLTKEEIVGGIRLQIGEYTSKQAEKLFKYLEDKIQLLEKDNIEKDLEIEDLKMRLDYEVACVEKYKEQVKYMGKQS